MTWIDPDIRRVKMREQNKKRRAAKRTWRILNPMSDKQKEMKKLREGERDQQERKNILRYARQASKEQNLPLDAILVLWGEPRIGRWQSIWQTSKELDK